MIQYRAIVTVNVNTNWYAIYRMVLFPMILNGLTNLTKIQPIWSVARPLCDSWAFCQSITPPTQETRGRSNTTQCASLGAVNELQQWMLSTCDGHTLSTTPVIWRKNRTRGRSRAWNCTRIVNTRPYPGLWVTPCSLKWYWCHWILGQCFLLLFSMPTTHRLAIIHARDQPTINQPTTSRHRLSQCEWGA